MLNLAVNKELENPIKNKYVVTGMSLYILVWIITAINPVYRPEWLLENYIVFLTWGLIALSFYKYRLSALSYNLLFVYLSLHCVGAHYGYSDVPFGFWMSKYFGFERANTYDRLVHFLFGFLLCHPLREILKRYSNLSNVWLIILPAEFILSYSAAYELFEAIIAWTMPAKSYDPFVGLQGDIWDGYRDMLLAFVGALIITFWSTVNYLYSKYKK